MSIKVISSGLLTTIQDRGRYGYAKYGVPVGGAMDSYAAKVANLLVGNSGEEALMEITMIGPELEFDEEAYAVLAGLGAQASLNGDDLALNTPFKVEKGDVLHIKQVTKGIRVYLAVKGGFKTKKVLESRSFYNPITSKNKLEDGDQLRLAPFNANIKDSLSSVHFAAESYDLMTLRVFSGPEWTLVPEYLRDKLLNTFFTVSKNNNRQAYQLNEQFKNELKPILTQPVLPGTVQVTPGGNLIVLTRDCQTTGGYPRIFQVTEKSLNLLAQKRAGDKIKFIIKNQN